MSFPVPQHKVSCFHLLLLLRIYGSKEGLGHEERGIRSTMVLHNRQVLHTVLCPQPHKKETGIRSTMVLHYRQILLTVLCPQPHSEIFLKPSQMFGYLFLGKEKVLCHHGWIEQEDRARQPKIQLYCRDQTVRKILRFFKSLSRDSVFPLKLWDAYKRITSWKAPAVDAIIK